MVNILKPEESIIQLLENRRYISGEKLAKKLNLSRTAIWKHIKKLRSQNYVIESKPKAGYKLTKKTSLLLPFEIKNNLKTSFLGKEIRHFEEVDSTQEIAKRMAREGAGEGTLIISERQKLGRGRMGRKWISPTGGVWLSLILRPKLAPSQAQRMTLAVAVATAKTFNRLYNINAKIKWPNDILVNGRKICGILIETEGEMDRLNFMIVGVGANINVNIEAESEIVNIATSVRSLLGREVFRPEFVRVFLEEFEYLYNQCNSGFFSEILIEWRNLSDTLGKLVTVETPNEKFEGVASDLDNDGFLIVKLSNGTERKIFSGDIKIMRSAIQI